jgi:hypothetical protein
VLLDERGRAKICDLGLAVSAGPDGQRSMVSGPQGTPGSVSGLGACGLTQPAGPGLPLPHTL